MEYSRNSQMTTLASMSRLVLPMIASRMYCLHFHPRNSKGDSETGVGRQRYRERPYAAMATHSGAAVGARWRSGEGEGTTTACAFGKFHGVEGGRVFFRAISRVPSVDVQEPSNLDRISPVPSSETWRTPLSLLCGGESEARSKEVSTEGKAAAGTGGFAIPVDFVSCSGGPYDAGKSL